MKKLIVFLFGIAILSSCNIRRNDGNWNDNIHLSQKKVEFSAQADSVTITTKGGWWWINDVNFQDSTYYYIYTENNFSDELFTISDNDFSVTKIDENTIFIKINMNATGYERTMYIHLEDGDYFDDIRIIQKAE